MPIFLPLQLFHPFLQPSILASPPPYAFHAGDDCCETMRVLKIHNYRDHLEDLRFQGIIYTPVIWSCWGREHEDTTKVLRQIARAAARR